MTARRRRGLGDKVASLADGTRTMRQIADQLQCMPEFVGATLRRRGLQDMVIKRLVRLAEANDRPVLFPRDILDGLAPHAAKRCIHPNSLARMIVEIAVDEGLIDCILDDGGEPHE